MTRMYLRFIGTFIVLAGCGPNSEDSCEDMGAIEDKHGLCVCPAGTVARSSPDRCVDATSESTSSSNGGDASTNAKPRDAGTTPRSSRDASSGADPTDQSQEQTDPVIPESDDTQQPVSTARDAAIATSPSGSADGSFTQRDSGSSPSPSTPECVPTSEVCDGKDNDCDRVPDNGLQNACGGPCDKAVPKEDCSTAADDDCDGQVNEGCVPTPPACVPTAETCDEKDNDCDGVIDNGVQTVWYRDCDGDGYASSDSKRTSVSACTKPALVAGCAAWVSQEPLGPRTDCNDDNAAYKPGAGFGYADGSSDDLNCDGVVESEVKVFSSNVTNDLSGQFCMNPDGGPVCYCFLPTDAQVRNSGQIKCTNKPTDAKVRSWYVVRPSDDPLSASNSTGPCAILAEWNADGSGIQGVYELHNLCR